MPRNRTSRLIDERVKIQPNNRATLQNPNSRTPHSLHRLPLRSPEHRAWMATAHKKHPRPFVKFVEGPPQPCQGPNEENIPPVDVVIRKALDNKNMMFFSDGPRGNIWMVNGEREDVVLALVEGGWSGIWEILGVGEEDAAGRGMVFLVRRAPGYELILEEEQQILRDELVRKGKGEK
ncbi:MAG: hypothetical protein MMC33_002991 [Icmadophila ericetorum]|nr:hypothetical protein [Icmadophila ericetorum]